MGSDDEPKEHKHHKHKHKPVWKSDFTRPTPSTRCYLREWVCSMAWRFHAVDNTLAHWSISTGTNINTNIINTRRTSPKRSPKPKRRLPM